MLSIQPFSGKEMPTFHLSDRPFSYSRLLFSPNESLLLRAPSGSGHLTIWDLKTRESVFDVEMLLDGPFSFAIGRVAFSPDSLFVATCYLRELILWNIPDGSAVWRFFLPDHISGRGIDFLGFSPEGKQLFVVAQKGMQLLIVDAPSGTIVDARTLSAVPAMFLGLDCRGNSIHSFFVVSSTGQDSRFIVTDIFNNSLLLELSLGIDDTLTFSPNNRLALICRHDLLCRGEVWDLHQLKRPHLHELTLPTGTWDSVIGLDDRFFANPYFEGSPVPVLGKCLLAIWDLHTGIRLRLIENTLSCEIRWASKSPLLVMVNPDLQSTPPLRNIALFFDPFTAIVRGHAYDHWAATNETSILSPSGHWFASIFDSDFTNNHGSILHAGAIAVTDLSSILRPVQEPSG